MIIFIGVVTAISLVAFVAGGTTDDPRDQPEPPKIEKKETDR